MIKLLILVEDYPNNSGNLTFMYVHTRNLYYAKNGFEVTVLSFNTKEDYFFQGIKVLSLRSWKVAHKTYDVLILHAANIRHHYLFLKKYGNRFDKKIFFYHGHEVLKINHCYPKPYAYMKKNPIGEWMQNLYDTVKLALWRKYLCKNYIDSYFIFVSMWMKDNFMKYTKLPDKILSGRSSITYNCVGEKFEKGIYDAKRPKEFDFITIRGNLDGSKYAVDIVNRLAWNTPNAKFVLYGKGAYFEHNKKAPNLMWKNQTLDHYQIVSTLNRARFGLMPTRTDAQGLMMCEMAAYGIPVVTSDIDVCHEVFDGFQNAFFIDNDDITLSLDDFGIINSECIKDDRYYKDTTISTEMNIIRNLKKT